ncbi:MAG TPA: RidA family protein [Streptomyces sp.]|nr:RidA family protein [Streptomyces sp.]
MSELTHIQTPAGLAPGYGYSHVVWGEGRFVAISGQMALNEHGEVVGVNDPAAQARQVFANVRRCLNEAGATFDNVVKFTFFVTDMRIMPAVREARDACINPERPPASTAVQVYSLVHPEMFLEVEAFAIIPPWRM